MKLHEIATARSYISEEAAEWLWKKRQNHTIGNHFIQRDGTIDVDGSVEIHSADGRELPVQFGKVRDGFYCSGSDLTTLRGCPREVGEDFVCSNIAITSFDGVPLIIGSEFRCFEVKVSSLAGIGKTYARHIGGTFKSNRVFTHMLGLLLVDGLTNILTMHTPVDKILNKYLGTGDILSAQHELIEAGFTDQARL